MMPTAPASRPPVRRRVALAFAGLFWAPLAWLSAAPVWLDFGQPDSPVRDGFSGMGTAAIEGVAAWEGASDRRAGANPIRREWTYSDSTGREDPPSSYATELSCDHVSGQMPAVLHLHVPAGPYRVWLLTGAAGGNPAQVWDVAVASGGARAAATFAGAVEIRELQLDAVAGEDGLRVTFSSRSRWLVNALAAVPAAEWETAVADRIAAIRSETFLLPPDVLAKWKETPPSLPQPTADWSEEDQARGFAVFHRHYLEPVWPATVPTAQELSAPVRAFAAQDDYEPMTFTIHPLRDADEVDLSIGDLTAEGGAAIPAAAVDVRWVRYLHVRPNYRTFGTYYRAPDVLMPWTPQPLRAGENLRVWLTVYVAPGTPAGLYRGTVRVRRDGRDAASVPLTLRVVPITLQKDRSLVYGHYYHHPYRNLAGSPDTFSRSWWARKAELEHADMAAHGNNTLVLGLGGRQVNGVWRLDFDALARCIDLYHRHGFHQPIICSFPVSSLYAKYMQGGMGSHLRLVRMPPPEFFSELTALVRLIEEERRRRQWPELLYYPVDEPSTQAESVAFMTAVLQAIKDVPGVRTYVTADPAHAAFAPMRPVVDVWCCQPFSLDRETIEADMAARNVSYWCYPNHIAGENDHTPCAGARMTYGFGFWRSGFRALTPWIYQAIVGDQWNYLDGGAMDFFNRTADDASPIPVALWEAYREGIDDGRYITTLQRTIERAKAAGRREAAAEAEADLQLVWTAIRVQPKYMHQGLWDGETFDVYRWLLATRILRLQEAIDLP